MCRYVWYLCVFTYRLLLFKSSLVCVQIALAGLVDHVAKRDPEVRGPLAAYKCLSYDQHIFVHMHSCMRKQAAEWVCFLELSETSRVYMKGVTPVDAKWLPRLAPSMCHRTTPLEVTIFHANFPTEAHISNVNMRACS